MTSPNLFQQQVILGSTAAVHTTSGQVVVGTVQQIGTDEIILDVGNKQRTLLLEAVAGWEIHGTGNVPEPISLIQQQFPIGRHGTFHRKVGQSVSGTLIEIGLNHIILEQNNARITLLPSGIDGWDLDADLPPAMDTRAEDTPASPHQLKPGEKPSEPADGVTGINSSYERIVIAELASIEAKYETRRRLAKLDPEPLDLRFPASEFAQGLRAAANDTWQRIKSIHDYAVRTGELEPRFGRVARIAGQLSDMSDQYPTALTLKRQAGACYQLAGLHADAIRCLLAAAMGSSQPADWRNLAAVALADGREELACYSLRQFYSLSPVTEDVVWFVYADLIPKCSCYGELAELLRLDRMAVTNEAEVLFQATMYFLRMGAQRSEAAQMLTRRLNGESAQDLALSALRRLESPPTAAYQRVLNDFQIKAKAQPNTAIKLSPKSAESRITASNIKLMQGKIKDYRANEGWGFIRGDDGREYFLHRNEIIDEKLIQMLQIRRDTALDVSFVPTQSGRGFVARQIEHIETGEMGQATQMGKGRFVARPIERSESIPTLAQPPQSLAEMMEQASKHFEDTEYQSAAQIAKKVVAIDPNYPNAQTLYAKWNNLAIQRNAHDTDLPRGTNHYTRAKNAEIIEKDDTRAERFYRAAIERNERTDAAVKDLAMLLSRHKRDSEAIKLLLDYREKAPDPLTIDGLLTTLYPRVGEPEKAIPLLQKRADLAPNISKKAQILWVIANINLGQGKFDQAERNFQAVLNAQPTNMIAKRNIAICQLKQERYDQAERLLNEILRVVSDPRAVELLDAVREARGRGLSSDIDILINTLLSPFPVEISGFTHFFLDRCEYEGVPPDRKQEQVFNRQDVTKLEERAQALGTRIPRDRGRFLLSAAKIESQLEDGDPNRFHRYLCRTFASFGDATILESGLRDSACELYCEALAVYDNDHDARRDEQDAINALVRALYATLGAERVPMSSSYHVSIEDTIDRVLELHPRPEVVFETIEYLIYRSRYAAARILQRLHRSPWRKEAVKYLDAQGVPVLDSLPDVNAFAGAWDELRRRRFEVQRKLSSEFRYLMRLELTTSFLESALERIQTINSLLFFELDRRRLRELQRLLEMALDLLRQTTFADRNRQSIQGEASCRDIMREFEGSPTKFSIENLHPVIQTLQQKLVAWNADLQERSTPSLSLRLPIDACNPADNRETELQITIENERERSAAESVELVISPNADFFEVRDETLLKLTGSLQGGQNHIFVVSLCLTPKAIHSNAFSLTAFAQYRTVSGTHERTKEENFSIKVGPQYEFETIHNPYAAYAKGGPVESDDMFYGRAMEIARMIELLKPTRTSKSVLLYGQKRSGKSSILIHLEKKLREDPSLLVLHIKNIGTIIEPSPRTPLIYQVLWLILRLLRSAVMERTATGFTPLSLTFPDDLKFYDHPAPLSYFQQIFDDFREQTASYEDWRSTRVILLIDEFQYIYSQIVEGSLNPTFMINWKAFLQRNYFSAVLAGQDVMPKFVRMFPNEFGTTEDLHIGYLERADAYALIEDPIRIGGKAGETRYIEEARERIFELTAGNPFYIQILCSRLVDLMNLKRSRQATKANVEQVKEILIDDVFNRSHFENLINSGDTAPDAIKDEDIFQVLKSIALNTKQVSTCDRSEITCRTSTPIDVILEDLVNRRVLDRERSSYYSVRVGLFKEWLTRKA